MSTQVKYSIPIDEFCDAFNIPPGDFVDLDMEGDDIVYFQIQNETETHELIDK